MTLWKLQSVNRNQNDGYTSLYDGNIEQLIFNIPNVVCYRPTFLPIIRSDLKWFRSFLGHER